MMGGGEEDYARYYHGCVQTPQTPSIGGAQLDRNVTTITLYNNNSYKY